ncbi:MAG: hypothetical protein ACPG32_15505, partial [Akkermansiaceae bacterium]
MNFGEIEWILVVHYGKTAHRATYGRLSGTTYTKDYIQLSRKPDFLAGLRTVFQPFADDGSSIPLVYKWPGGSAKGQLIPKSADRPHLTWETGNAPSPWRMLSAPTAGTSQTIVGDPSHNVAEDADREFDRLKTSGFGQPYLLAIKLRNEPNTLHLRVHVSNPSSDISWADINNAPPDIVDLANSTSQNSALSWKLYDANDDNVLYFDADVKANPWRVTKPKSIIGK